MPKTENIIAVKNLYKEYVTSSAFSLHVGNFHVKKGELLALVGPSGCGKSTALDLLSTSLAPDAQPHTQAESMFLFCPEERALDILAYWKNKKLTTLAQIRQKYIGYILQTGGLLPFLHGYDNILLSCFEPAHEKSIEILARALDIEHLLLKKPAQMSVGERQRFAVARSLVHEPKLILADEPVASLDPYNAELVLELLVNMAKDKNIAVVMVSHAPDMAESVGFRLVQAQISRSVKSTQESEQEPQAAQNCIHAYIATHNLVPENSFNFTEDEQELVRQFLAASEKESSYDS